MLRCLIPRVHKFFQKSGSNLKILGATTVACNTLRTQDPQTLDATAQNILSTLIWRRCRVQPYLIRYTCTILLVRYEPQLRFLTSKSIPWYRRWILRISKQKGTSNLLIMFSFCTLCANAREVNTLEIVLSTRPSLFAGRRGGWHLNWVNNSFTT